MRRYGRAGIYMMQEYCRLLGIGSSDSDLRDLGATLEALPADHPIVSVMRGAKDFSSPTPWPMHCSIRWIAPTRVPELYAWLERCGMSFGRWYEQAPYLPQCGMLATTPHAERLAALPPPLQHAAVELFRGTMVKHNLIAYRDDRTGDSQPITFVGDGWREYIPIALPWTICVRERLPPGSVAVLINRAHPFTDLILPVDSFENELLAAIDGNRTLAEILPSAPEERDGERRALGFFERLWQYDQIVFDGSRAS